MCYLDDEGEDLCICHKSLAEAAQVGVVEVRNLGAKRCTAHETGIGRMKSKFVEAVAMCIAGTADSRQTVADD